MQEHRRKNMLWEKSSQIQGNSTPVSNEIVHLGTFSSRDTYQIDVISGCADVFIFERNTYDPEDSSTLAEELPYSGKGAIQSYWKHYSGWSGASSIVTRLGDSLDYVYLEDAYGVV